MIVLFNLLLFGIAAWVVWEKSQGKLKELADHVAEHLSIRQFDAGGARNAAQLMGLNFTYHEAGLVDELNDFRLMWRTHQTVARNVMTAETNRLRVRVFEFCSCPDAQERSSALLTGQTVALIDSSDLALPSFSAFRKTTATMVDAKTDQCEVSFLNDVQFNQFVSLRCNEPNEVRRYFDASTRKKFLAANVGLEGNENQLLIHFNKTKYDEEGYRQMFGLAFELYQLFSRTELASEDVSGVIREILAGASA